MEEVGGPWFHPDQTIQGWNMSASIYAGFIKRSEVKWMMMSSSSFVGYFSQIVSTSLSISNGDCVLPAVVSERFISPPYPSFRSYLLGCQWQFPPPTFFFSLCVRVTSDHHMSKFSLIGPVNINTPFRGGREREMAAKKIFLPLYHMGLLMAGPPSSLLSSKFFTHHWLLVGLTWTHLKPKKEKKSQYFVTVYTGNYLKKII